jgi:hypothetical protein
MHYNGDGGQAECQTTCSDGTGAGGCGASDQVGGRHAKHGNLWDWGNHQIASQESQISRDDQCSAAALRHRGLLCSVRVRVLGRGHMYTVHMPMYTVHMPTLYMSA